MIRRKDRLTEVRVEGKRHQFQIEKQRWKEERQSRLRADPGPAVWKTTLLAMFSQKKTQFRFLWMFLSNEGHNSNKCHEVVYIRQKERDKDRKKEVIFTLPGGWLWISPAGTRISALRPPFLHRWTSFQGTCQSGWSCHWWRCRRFRMPPPGCWPAGSSPVVSDYWPE